MTTTTTITSLSAKVYCFQFKIIIKCISEQNWWIFSYRFRYLYWLEILRQTLWKWRKVVQKFIEHLIINTTTTNVEYKNRSKKYLDENTYNAPKPIWFYLRHFCSKLNLLGIYSKCPISILSKSTVLNLTIYGMWFIIISTKNYVK